MPIVNRFAKPPRAWPPPRSPEEIRDAVAFAEERDPIGTAVHLGLAVAFCASISLSTAMTSVSFVLLVGYTALRTPNLWRAWMPLVASPVSWLWLGWMMWTALNAFWSADLERWRDSLGSFWCVALLPALYPLSGRWRLLIGAFVVGAAAQAVLQWFQVMGVMSMSPDNPFRPAGIGSHPGHVTTSGAIALMLVLSWARSASSGQARIVATLSIALLLSSIVFAAGRGAILGTAVGLAVAFASLFVRWGIPWSSRWLQAACLFGVVSVTALAILTLAGRGPTSLGFQLENLKAQQVESLSSVSKRYLWWELAGDALRQHPLRGIGTGSLYAYSSTHPKVEELSKELSLPVDAIATRHPHSFYMLVAAEQGLVGFAWLGGIVMLTTAAAWKATAMRPIACGILAGLAVWLVAAAFECLNLPLRTASMFLMLSVIVALPRGPGAGLEPCPTTVSRR